MYAQIGTDVTLQWPCGVVYSIDKGDEPNWLRKGSSKVYVKLPTERYRFSELQDDRQCNLTLYYVTADDSGLYRTYSNVDGYDVTTSLEVVVWGKYQN